MKVVVSPAKKLDFENCLAIEQKYAPAKNLFFPNKTKKLVSFMQTRKASDIKKLMSLSDDLSLLNYNRYQQYFESSDKRMALFAFAGDTYQGLKAWEFSEEDFSYAKNHLFILSGLYGLLQVDHEIKPYRLEMGTRLKFDSYNNLYQYWGSDIAAKINELNDNSEYLVNLSSEEYFKSIDKNALQAKIIDVHFLEDKKGVLKAIGMTSKRARGSMASYIVRNKLNKIEDLYDFEFNGHVFDKKMSDKTNLYFIKR